MHERYRPDIDGLRAIAVLAVALFHANVPGFDGGFIGVDIFFVISGFVITQSLLASSEQRDRFLLRFYARRIRRLVPAMAVMVMATTVAVALLSTAEENAAYAQSARAVIFSYGNFHFYGLGGYFAPAAGEQPLLHGWSLGVEEQFYLFWPIILSLLCRYLPSTARNICVSLALAGSFALSIWLLPERANAAFYMLPSRGWELLLGCLVALLPVDRIASGNQRPLLWIGLLLVVTGFLVIDASGSFPGWWALMPTVGTALMLAAGLQSAPDHAAPSLRLLVHPVLVFVGKTSYGFYLWHFPMLVLAGWVAGKELHWQTALIVLLFAFGLAWLSWRFLEQPICRAVPQSGYDPRAFVGFAVVCSILVGAVSGIPYVIPASGTPVAAAQVQLDIADQGQRAHGCHLSVPIKVLPDCLYAAPDGSSRHALLWGDSHADALAPAIMAEAARQGLGLAHVTRSGCPPAAGLEVWNNMHGLITGCAQFNDQMLARVAQDDRIKLLLLHARWTVYADGEGLATDPYDQLRLVARDGLQQPSAKLLSRGLEAVLVKVRAARPDLPILLIGPVPEPGFMVARCVQRRAAIGLSDTPCRSMAWASAEVRVRQAEAILDKHKTKARIGFVALTDIFCGRALCQLIDQTNKIWYRDGDHVSGAGGVQVAAVVGRHATWKAANAK